MSIDDTQYDLEAEKKARQQEFEKDLKLLVNNWSGEDWYEINEDEKEKDIIEFIEKWSPK